jgi:methionyl-tRNA synthetase
MSSSNSTQNPSSTSPARGPLTDIPSVLKSLQRPKRAVVTSGMPYANAPLHLGHIAGVYVPADVYARWLDMLIGRENVMYVNGTDDHGSTSEVAALKAGKPIREFIDEIHSKQKKTLERYSFGVDVYTGTSRPECFPIHCALSQDFIRKLYKNGMLEKRVTQQWYDPKLSRFLPDRYVVGKCPNPKCENTSAYSDGCEVCGLQYEPAELMNPKSTFSDAVPVLKDTAHLWLNLWKVAEVMRVWFESKEGSWRKPILAEVLGTILPTIQFDVAHEPAYKEIKAQLPKHKPRYAPGKKIALQFESLDEMNRGRKQIEELLKVETSLVDAWAHRSITRDVHWGIPIPEELDPEMKGKTLYVWPDSLIAPIAFTQVALKAKGESPARFAEFWKSPDTRICQFIGQDNVFFYTIMQAALWIGSQDDITRLPKDGEFQLTEIFSVYHLMVNGEKMSKSRGNYFTGDQMLDEKGYTADQVRYFLATLSLPEKQSNCDLATLEERNKFLAGPMNAAFEKPISAVHSKFGGRVPEGKLNEKVQQETLNLVRRYVKSMERADYSNLLGQIENYARQINSLFTQFKPHDDRFPEEQRRDALYSSFYVLKNLMILLYPFVPETMNRLRETLRLPPGVFSVDQLGVAIPAGHEIGQKQQYFPAVAAAEIAEQ